MKFTVRENWYDLKSKIIKTVDIKKSDLNLWYKEITRRWWCLAKIQDEEEKQKCLELLPIYDIDESIACKNMSIEQYKNYSSFIWNIKKV